MTNKEVYAKEILDLYCSGVKDVAVKREAFRDIVCACSDITCSECALLKADDSECYDVFTEWCESEYKEYKPEIDWSKVPVDTPILVKYYQSAKWVKRHFAKYENKKSICLERWMYFIHYMQ